MNDDYLEVSRTLAASRDKVFAAWSQPEQFAQWYGPREVSLASCTIDFKVGGKWNCQMKSPNGWEMWLAGEFTEIVPGRLIVKTVYPSDAAGNKQSHEGWSDEIQERLILTEEADQTKVTLQYGPMPPSPGRTQAEHGWVEALECLEEFLQGQDA